MSVLDQELKDVEPYLLTRREYAALVKAASQKVIKEYILLHEQSERDFREWESKNHAPKKPHNYHSSHTAYDRWHDEFWSYRMKLGDEYQKTYHLAMSVNQLKLNIMLADIIEDGSYETERKKSNFSMFFRGVNNPLLNHGQSVFHALLHGKHVPEHVLAEWPEGVAQVQQEITLRAAQDKIN